MEKKEIQKANEISEATMPVCLEEYREKVDILKKYDRYHLANDINIHKAMDEYVQRLKAEWDLSEKGHDETIKQLRRTQEARNQWEDMANRLAEEMRQADWDSPLYWEYKKLVGRYHTGNG